MNKKLEYFAQIIEREVELKKQRAKHRLANDLGEKAAEEIKKAEKIIYTYTEEKKRDLKRRANKKIAAATAEAKAAFNETRTMLNAKMLDGVSEKLKEFTQSAEYEIYLTERIRAARAVQGFHAGVVKLRPEDMRFAQAIHQATGLTPVTGENDYAGGFILQSKNEKIKADYTFKTQLEIKGAP
jgi:vacuolar-type H+-ATPase subunit E/Vma4